MIAEILTAVVWLGAAVLIWAGAAKLFTPDTTMTILHRMKVGPLRAPSGPVTARLLACFEILVGVAVILLGDPVAPIAAAVWLALTGVALFYRRRGEACGCFGVDPTRVTFAHVVINAVFLLATAAAATGRWVPEVSLRRLGDLTSTSWVLTTTAGLVMFTGAGLVTVVATRMTGETTQ